MSDEADQARTASEYLAVIRRRYPVILVCLIIAPVAAYVLVRHETRIYRGTASVLLNPTNLADQLTGTSDPQADESDPTVYSATQASLARSANVIQPVAAHGSRYNSTVSDFADHSSVTLNTGTNILTFDVDDPRPDVAISLALAYATQFIAYSVTLDTQAIVQAEHEVQNRLNALPSSNALYPSLVSRLAQLQTLATLQTANASLVRQTNNGGQVAPRISRDVAIAVILGLLLGGGLALLFDALDTRVSDVDAIGVALGAPLLGRLTRTVPRRGSGRGGFIVTPNTRQAEEFRLLRAAISFVLPQHDARVIMVTSATASEGKTTTVVNLAAAFARSNRRITVVDLDLRRPKLAAALGVSLTPGITDVLMGDVAIRDALVRVTLSGDASDGTTTGSVTVLPSGTRLPSSIDIASFGGFAGLFAYLAAQSDLVIVDTPPFVHFSDALNIAAHVDGIIVVARLGLLTRPALRELQRLLRSAAAPVLGVVATGEGNLPNDYYGYQDGPTSRAGSEATTPPERETLSRG